MGNVKILTSDAEIDAAIEEARHAPVLPAAKRAEFLPGVRLLLIELKSGQRLALPVEDLEELAHATDEQLATMELLGPGTGIYFPAFDGNLYVPYLMEGSRGSKNWMEQLEAKRVAALKAAA
jgi:hypothetical protein